MRRHGALRPASAEELLGSLAARRAAVQSIRARVRVRAGIAGMWVREALLVRRPNAIRMDVLSPFGLALAVGTDGALLWAYPAGEGTRYEGPATPENLARFLGAPVRIEDLVDVLLGLPPARVAVAPPVLRVANGAYELTVPLADGATTVRFAGDTLQVLGADETRQGRSTLRVAFSDYREDGFPHAVEVSSAEHDAHASLVYDAVEVNPTLDGTLFAAPPARRVLPLTAASTR
jgi:hypothetical protein